MSTSRRLYIVLAVIVAVWYLASTFLPQVSGSCLSGTCNSTAGIVAISLLIPVAMAAIPVVLEVVLYKKGLAQALSDIGITRFSTRALKVVLVYLLPLFAFFPLLALIASRPLALQPRAAWLVTAALLNNGLNEEIMMRGFVFRHLREGRTFWRAAALSTVYFAAYHVPLIVFAGPIVGVIGILIAIPTGLLTAYVYERGENTIWGDALVHAGTNAPAFIFTFAEDFQPIATILFLLVGIVMSIAILIWAYRSRFQRPVQPGAATVTPSVSR